MLPFQSQTPPGIWRQVFLCLGRGCGSLHTISPFFLLFSSLENFHLKLRPKLLLFAQNPKPKWAFLDLRKPKQKACRCAAGTGPQAWPPPSPSLGFPGVWTRRGCSGNLLSSLGAICVPCTGIKSRRGRGGAVRHARVEEDRSVPEGGDR